MLINGIYAYLLFTKNYICLLMIKYMCLLKEYIL